MPTAWGVHLAASDAVALTARIEDAGGRVITRPTRVGSAGITALVADPGGAVFGLWQAQDRAGFEKQGRPGSFAWAEVYTRAADKDAVDAFYETVFGYRTRDLDDPAVDYRVWSPRTAQEASDETAIGGRSVIGPAFPRRCPPTSLCTSPSRTATPPPARPRTARRPRHREPFDTPYGRIAVLAGQPGRGLRGPGRAESGLTPGGRRPEPPARASLRPRPSLTGVSDQG